MANLLRPNKSKLKNAQHFSFYDAFFTVFQQAGFTAPKIMALKAKLDTAFQEEDRWYMQARNSELIAQRDEADRRRDNFYSRLHAIIRAWADSGDPEMESAANVLVKAFQLYKLKTAAQMEEETGVMENLKSDLSTAENLARMETLHVTWLFQQMCAAHEQVKSIRLQEGAEMSEKVTGALVAARKTCDGLYDELTRLIEAATLFADDPAPYEAFIRQWNGTLKIYQDMLDRKSGESAGGTANPDGTGEKPDNNQNNGNNENENNNNNNGNNNNNNNQNENGGNNTGEGGDDNGGNNNHDGGDDD